MRNLDSVPLKDWTFEELQGNAVWLVISALSTGQPLRTAMWSVLTLAMNWQKERTTPTKEPGHE